MSNEGKGLRVVRSNSLHSLAESLANAFFFQSRHPFESRAIVVPDAAMKEFLCRYFVSHPRIQVAAGMRIVPLNLFVMGREGEKKIPSFLELSLAIEEKLYAHSESLSELAHYLASEGLGKRRQRVAALSDELARLFGRYGLYGERFLREWLNAPDQGFQQALWKEIFQDASLWTYPLALSQSEPQGKVALFGFSYLPPVYLRLFGDLNAAFYLLSPCAHFWEDFSSEKERIYLSRTLRKNGMRENVVEEIEGYLRQSHPLLGNWGRLHRQMLKSLEEVARSEEERYIDPQGASQLKRFQHAMLTLEESPSASPDDSLQLHSATSKLREVEILCDALRALLYNHEQKGDPIALSEVCVVCPDIVAYAPYIQMVFSSSPFPFAITGMPSYCLSETVHGFFELLKLPQEDFAPPALFKLLRLPCLTQEKAFVEQEIALLKKWCKHAEIRGGVKSWEDGVDRLLFGLAMISLEGQEMKAWPAPGIAQSEIPLFERFLTFFSALREDLSLLSGQKSAEEWLALFMKLAEAYFLIAWDKEPFFNELKALAHSSRHFKEKCWDYNSIYRVLEHLRQKPSGEIASSRWQKIRFAPFGEGSLGSARLIWCLGMDEEAFPRRDTPSSLCALTDYFPLKSEEDRSLFLELFLKAEDYLCFSYTRIHPEDNKLRAPSLLIDELDQHLMGGISKKEHPAFCFEGMREAKKRPFFTAKSASLSNEEEILIDLSKLKKLARNPLQFYFNETLKIYLKEEEDEEEKEFLLSRLRMAALRKRGLKGSVPHVLTRLEGEGKLPRALFQEAAAFMLHEEVGDLVDCLREFSLSPQEITAISIPPLTVTLSAGRQARIVGKLQDVTPQGLLFEGKKDLESLVKAYPLYLVYRCLDPKNRTLILTKARKAIEVYLEDPHQTLAAYIEYYLFAKETPSWLMPAWAKPLLDADPLNFERKRDSLKFRDPYIEYLRRRGALPSPEEAIAWCNKGARALFSPLFSLEAPDDAL